ncbi:MAG: Gx transporter family protein [Candidatus Enteromonas sp.]|nr:Gx transporter family protein [Candidatus Enteromonas sp.]
MDTRARVRKVTLIAMLLAMALTLSIVESFIPFGIPGMKLGLANLVILLSIYYFGFWIPLAIDLARVVVASLFTGTFLQMGFVMSLSGAILSFFLMYVGYRWLKMFTPVGVSILGAYAHALAQMFVAVLYLENWGVFYYFPVMAFSSLVTGTINGFLVEALLANKYLTKSVEMVKRGQS